MKVLVHAIDAVSLSLSLSLYNIKLGSWDIESTCQRQCLNSWSLADRLDGRFSMRQENEKLKCDVSTKSEAWSEASSVEHVC